MSRSRASSRTSSRHSDRHSGKSKSRSRSTSRAPSPSPSRGNEELNRDLDDPELKEQLRLKLTQKLNETGWRDQVKLRIIEYIHLKGMDNISMEDIIKATAVKARYMVPEQIVKELQQEVKNYREEK